MSVSVADQKDAQLKGQRGLALVVVMMALVLLSAVGATLVFTATGEVAVAANVQNAGEALFAADAMLERAIADLAVLDDWSPVLSGVASSSFVDGPPGGRTLSDGRPLDVGSLASLANCGRADPCTAAQMDLATAARPWGANNPRWRLFGHGPLGQLLPAGAVDSAFYGVVFAADDPAEIDSDPALDGGSTGGIPSPGRGVIVLRAAAYGPRQAHRTIEATVCRFAPGPGGLRIASWKEVSSDQAP